MALPAYLDSLDEVPESLRDHYRESESGTGYVLDAEGVEDVRGLKSTLARQKEDARRAKEERDRLRTQYEGIDLDEYQRLREAADQATEQELIDAGKVDEIVAQRVKKMQDEHAKALTGLQEQNQTLQTTLTRELITNRLHAAALEARIRKEALADVTLLGERVFKLVDGAVRATDPTTGDVLYGKDGEPLTMAEWLAEREQDRPHWFEPSSGGGAPPGGGSPNGRNGAAGKQSRAQMSAQEAARYIGEHGQEAYLDLPA